MKKMIIVLFLLFGMLMLAASEQNKLDPNLEAFIGIWEYKNENNLFRVEIRKNHDGTSVFGHYWLIEINNAGEEIIIDQSSKEILEGSDEFWTEAFSGYSKDGIELRGLIRDVTPQPKDVNWIDGLLKMTITNQSLEPLKAHWRVTYDGPIFYDARFQIPTNCILSKVE